MPRMRPYLRKLNGERDTPKKPDPLGDAINERLDQTAAANRARSEAALEEWRNPASAAPPDLIFSHEQFRAPSAEALRAEQRRRRPTQQRPIDPYTGR